MKFFSRLLADALTSSASKGKILLLFGARQTGKSTLLQLTAPENCVFFNLQDRKLRLEFERNPNAFTQILEADSRPSLSVFIDEIQKVPALLDEIQFLFDRHPKRFQFVLTGSSARKLKTSSANLLPGRSHMFQLCPLIVPERRNQTTSRIFPLSSSANFSPGFPAASLDELLLYGNLPGVALESDATRARTLETYAELYLEEEIRREGLVRNVGSFYQFLELAALESGLVMNLTNISRESGIPVATIRSYYQVLEDTFIGYRILPFGARGRKRVLTTPRFLFFDCGVRNAAARLHFSEDILKTQRGLLFENWVGQELVHRCLYSGRSYRVSFWRTVHGAEVDYVLETPEEAIPIEVKSTAAPRASDASHVELFLETYSKVARRGFVICQCDQPRRLTERVEAVPWNML